LKLFGILLSKEDEISKKQKKQEKNKKESYLRRSHFQTVTTESKNEKQF
jgi:hypothetical protein